MEANSPSKIGSEEMVMTDGGNSFDLSDYVRYGRKSGDISKCTDFGKNELFSFTDRTLMNLGYKIDDSGRMLGPQTSKAREYSLANREVSYQMK